MSETWGQVIEVRSDVQRACQFCKKSVGTPLAPSTEDMVNHMLSEHGCGILHVGQETTMGDEGPWQATVYVLGR